MKEGFRLLLHASCEPPLGDQFQVFGFVRLGQLDIVSTGLQLDVFDLAQQFERRVEVQFQIVVLVEIVLSQPREAIVELRVQHFQVLHGQRLAQHAFVER